MPCPRSSLHPVASAHLQVALLMAVITYMSVSRRGWDLRHGRRPSELLKEEKKQLVAARHRPIAGETRAWHAVPLDVQIRKRNLDEK